MFVTNISTIVLTILLSACEYCTSLTHYSRRQGECEVAFTSLIAVDNIHYAITTVISYIVHVFI